MKPKRSSRATVKHGGYTLIQGKKNKRIIGYIAFACVLSVMVIIAILFNSIAPTGVVDWMKVSFSGNAGGGFPIEYDSSIANDIYVENERLLVLTGTDIKCYSSSGAEIYSRIQGYADPSIKTSEMRTLVLERGSFRYKIESAYDTVYEDELENKIITGDICNSGTYAIVTESESELCEVTVYNKNNSAVYRFNSVSGYITDVSLSDDGKRLCVVSIGAENAKLISTVSVYKISSVNAIFTNKYNGEAVYKCNFNGNNINLITESRMLRLNSKGDQKEFLFGDLKLQRYEFFGSDTLLCLAPDAGSAITTVAVISSGCKERAKFSVDCSIVSACADKGSVYLLSDTEVLKYSYSGELKQSVQTDKGAIGIKALNGKVIILYADRLDKVEF